MTTVELVGREELERRRAWLLARAGMSREELDQGAEEFTLTDEQRTIYDTVSGIDWLLAEGE